MKSTPRILVGLSVAAAAFMGLALNGAGAKLSLISTAQADDRDRGGKNCSTQKLRGTFGVAFNGVSLPDVKLNSVALITFDGAGRFTVSEKGRLNGKSLNRTFSGPYTVLPDCFGALDFSGVSPPGAGPFHAPFVITNEGKELLFTVDADGWQVSGIGKRL